MCSGGGTEETAGRRAGGLVKNTMERIGNAPTTVIRVQTPLRGCANVGSGLRARPGDPSSAEQQTGRPIIPTEAALASWFDERADGQADGQCAITMLKKARRGCASIDE